MIYLTNKYGLCFNGNIAEIHKRASPATLDDGSTKYEKVYEREIYNTYISEELAIKLLGLRLVIEMLEKKYENEIR